MNETDDIKAIVPIICPHCKETSMVELSLGAHLLDMESAAKILDGLEQNKVDNTTQNATEKEAEEA